LAGSHGNLDPVLKPTGISSEHIDPISEGLKQDAAVLVRFLPQYTKWKPRFPLAALGYIAPRERKKSAPTTFFALSFMSSVRVVSKADLAIMLVRNAGRRLIFVFLG
jgi:hypothetical protein